jgi:queuosine precursor transporter
MTSQKLETGTMSTYKLLPLLSSLYITFQLVSDITASKIVSFLSLHLSITVFFFPLTLIIADVLTEVYGYEQAKKVTWLVFVCSVLAGIIYSLIHLYPSVIPGQDVNFEAVLGNVPRVLIGGWIAVFAGGISNNYVLSKLKILTSGKFLWFRTISSTILGEFVNTALFYIIALWGVIPTEVLIQSVVSAWLIKTILEITFTPIVYIVVDYVKRVEKIDVVDDKVNYNPFFQKL